MGYTCPVCGAPQADGEHLANHLAITAMTHGEDHEDWLDDHATDWRDCSPEELAERATAYAEETDYETVFEDTTGDGRGRFEDELQRQVGGQTGGRGDLTGRHDGPTGDTEAALEEARKLTEQMLDDEEESEPSEE